MPVTLEVEVLVLKGVTLAVLEVLWHTLALGEELALGEVDTEREAEKELTPERVRETVVLVLGEARPLLVMVMLGVAERAADAERTEALVRGVRVVDGEAPMVADWVEVTRGDREAEAVRPSEAEMRGEAERESSPLAVRRELLVAVARGPVGEMLSEPEDVRLGVLVGERVLPAVGDVPAERDAHGMGEVDTEVEGLRETEEGPDCDAERRALLDVVLEALEHTEGLSVREARELLVIKALVALPKGELLSVAREEALRGSENDTLVLKVVEEEAVDVAGREAVRDTLIVRERPPEAVKEAPEDREVRGEALTLGEGLTVMVTRPVLETRPDLVLEAVTFMLADAMEELGLGELVEEEEGLTLAEPVRVTAPGVREARALAENEGLADGVLEGLEERL